MIFLSSFFALLFYCYRLSINSWDGIFPREEFLGETWEDEDEWVENGLI
jgi:hypothetical protein